MVICCCCCCCWCWGFFFWNASCSILPKAHAGYLHLVRTSQRCNFSVLSNSGEEQTDCASCTNALITLYYTAYRKQHLREVLTKCKYPVWALDRMEHKYFQQNKPNPITNTNRSNNNIEPSNRTKGCIVIHYMQGLGESIKTLHRYVQPATHMDGVLFNF